MKARQCALFVLLVLVLPVIATAQTSRAISYQGVFTDTLGNPKPDGVYTFTFRLYDVSSGGSSIWMEAKNIDVRGGLFSTQLGDVSPFPSDLTFNGDYWLGVKPGAAAELSPRTKLAAVPLSRFAVEADSARVAASVPDNSITTAKIVPEVVSSIDGVSNDGGNVDLVAGTGISIISDDGANTITISEPAPTNEATAFHFVTFKPGSMSAIAFGSISSGGTISSGSGNFTVSWSGLYRRYEIAITGETYHSASYATVVTPIDQDLTANTGSVSGMLLVFFRQH